MERILITGATGVLGNSVINALLKRALSNQIYIVTRNEKKRAEFQENGFNAFLGDYNNIISLEKAMKGVDTVLLISAGDEGDRMQEHKNVINAAIKTGVQNIAYTSRALRNRQGLINKLMLDHFETEDCIRESGLKYIIFRNALYMDVIPLFVGKQVFKTGIFLPAGNGKVAFALREEQGEAMANVLLKETFDNQTYKFTGNEVYSFYDIAATLTALSGTDVKYSPIDTSEFENMMTRKGVPKVMIQKIIDFNLDIKNGQEQELTNDLELKLARKPTNLKNGLKKLFNL